MWLDANILVPYWLHFLLLSAFLVQEQLHSVPAFQIMVLVNKSIYEDKYIRCLDTVKDLKLDIAVYIWV